MRMCRTKWIVPLFSLAMGVVLLVAETIAHHLGSGLVSLGIMAGFGAVFLFGGRSETIRGLRGDGRDERFAQIDLRASWFAGMVVLTAILVAFVVQIARGHENSPYTWLAALFGASYLGAVIALRLRS